MAIKEEYKQDGNTRAFVFSIDGGKSNFIVESGTVICHKCGKPIPSAEMFCIPCFGKEPPPRPRAIRVKPDEGGLFAEELAEIDTDGSKYE